MSDFVVSAELRMDAAAARKEVARYSGELTKAGATTNAYSKTTTKAKSGTEKVARASNAAEKQVAALRRQIVSADKEILSMSRSQGAVANTTRDLGRANGAAAGSMGNLIAQFNDIGVMMAAGQNPLQLALQQGTQITQVIGPMGAAGAAKALGSALVGMVNPISLVTIGSIAAGAALTQWLTSGDSAAELTKKIEALEGAISSYNESADLATSSTEELEERFGNASTGLRLIIADLERIERTVTLQKLKELNLEISELMAKDGWFDSAWVGDKQRLDPFFEINRGLLTSTKASRAEADKLIASFASQRDALGAAAIAEDINGQVDAMHELLLTTERLANATAGVSVEEQALLDTMRDRLLMMLDLQAKTDTVDRAGAERAAFQQYYDTRIRSEEHLQNLKDEELSALAEIYQAYANARVQSDAVWQSGQNTVATLQSEIDLQEIIAHHGADSLQAAEARAQAERDAFIETELTADMSQTLRDMLLAAWDAANGVSSVDMSGNISLAANEAARLAKNLQLAARGNQMLTAARKNPDFFDPRNESGLAGEVDPNKYDVPLGLPGVDLPPNPKSKTARLKSGGSRGGGTSALINQRKATQDLIGTLETELELLRETDPIRQEMIRHRKALAGATEEERQRVLDLITTRQDEEDAIERHKEKWESFRDLSYGTFEDLRTSGGDLGAVFENLTEKLADMVYQAVLLGEGPLADMLGTSASDGSGGLLGTILGALLPKKATGGMIYGPGSGTSDDVLMYGSNGEFVVNARATAQHRPLLDAINSGGSIPAFANGGVIGNSGSSNRALNPVPIIIENRSSTPVTGEVVEESDGQGGRQYKLVLADEVGSAMVRRGGGANRAMRNQFGLKTVRPKR